jgi:hypothetical protein
MKIVCLVHFVDLLCMVDLVGLVYLAGLDLLINGTGP